jgi:homoserine/homoserine lactone efflux protein
MTGGILAAWAATMALISLTPGAGAVASMSSGAAHGWPRGIWTSLGQQAALVFLLLIAAAGLSSLLHAVPGALLVLQIVGALYLAWIGGSLLVASFRESQVAGPKRRVIPATPLGMVKLGFLVNATNPKALLAMFVITPRFLDLTHPLVPQYTALCVIMVAIDLVVMLGYTALGAWLLRSLTDARHRQRMDRIFGVLFLIAAAFVAKG